MKGIYTPQLFNSDSSDNTVLESLKVRTNYFIILYGSDYIKLFNMFLKCNILGHYILSHLFMNYFPSPLNECRSI